MHLQIFIDSTQRIEHINEEILFNGCYHWASWMYHTTSHVAELNESSLAPNSVAYRSSHHTKMEKCLLKLKRNHQSINTSIMNVFFLFTNPSAISCQSLSS